MGKHGLGEFELLILLAAIRLGEDDAHTLAIVDTITDRTGRAVHRASVYVTLQRMEAKGLVSSWLAEPRPERGGKGRRHVRVEPSGLNAVREARAALREMWGGIEPALEVKS